MRTETDRGLEITPFEIIYGRRPNLPIDNLLFRENYEKPITNLKEYLDYMFENQENLHLSLQKERQNRFDRNKRAAGEHKLNRTYKVGEKIYLTFPKGKFRPVGGSTKLSHRNDGPYTVLEEIQGGLVYRVKHDVSNYVHTTSVGRMIPVTTMVMPTNAVELPLPDKWKQLIPQRADRINDIPEEKHKEDAQQALREATYEAKEKKADEQTTVKPSKLKFKKNLTSTWKTTTCSSRKTKEQPTSKEKRRARNALRNRKSSQQRKRRKPQ